MFNSKPLKGTKRILQKFTLIFQASRNHYLCEKFDMFPQSLFYGFVVFLLLHSCDDPARNEDPKAKEIQTTSNSIAAYRELSTEFKDYWYSGLAEISSYDLKQDRYGEQRVGTAVFIFVTESFDPTEQVKADQPADSNRSVLKLNATRNFLTGIYPYTIMSSTFLPLDRQENAIKVATSVQEWCGHTYIQLNQKEDSYEGMRHSYFQGESNPAIHIKNVMLENQVPSQLRLNPAVMPVGAIEIIPSTEYLSLAHHDARAASAIASLKEDANSYTYTITFKSGRMIAYVTDKAFPYQIQSWKEEYPSNGSTATATATLKKTLRSAYWNQNSNKYTVLRDSLGL